MEMLAGDRDFSGLRVTSRSLEPGFPGGSVVKNPPAKAGGTALIPYLGGSHMPWSNSVRAPQLLSLCFRPREQKLLKPRHPRAHALKQEKPLQREAHGLQLESSPCSPPLEKSLCSNEDPAEPKYT